MRAILLILVPTAVLGAVMTAIFWLSGDPGRPSVESSRPAPTPSAWAGRAPEAPGPTATLASRPAVPAPATTTSVPNAPTSRGLGAAAEALAQAADDWANITRTRAKLDPTAQLKRARYALATSRPADAVAACDQILASHPDDVDALSAKAAALVMMRRFEEAAALYPRALEHRRDDLRLRFNYAVVLSRLSRFGEAIRHYELVLAARPDHAKAMYNLAVILQDEGKLTDAAKLWARVTRANPGLAGAWFNRGVVALQLGESEAARQAFVRADELEPGRADTRVNLGAACQGLGQLPQAIAAFQRAREVKPECLPAINGIAEVYLSYYEKNPDSDEHFECSLRWCEYSMRVRADQARLRSLFERALKARPDSVPAMNGLARVLTATSRDSAQYHSHRARAAELCRRSLEAQPNQADVASLLRRLSGSSTP